jgi:uncharacterized protein YjiS (DUF1127 family)
MFGAIAESYRSNSRGRVRHRGLWPRIRVVLGLWLHRIETRAELEGMPPERLRDLGLTPDQARAEARTPFWR